MSEDPDDFDPDLAPEETGFHVRINQQGGKGQSTDPVQNTEVHVPLFPELTKNAKHVIVKLAIFKMTAPNDGFKGYLPPNATLETIGRLYGNGRYDVHGLAQDDKVLRRNAGLSIALGEATGPQGTRPAPSGPTAPEMTLLTFQANQHDKDSSRQSATTDKHLAVVERQAIAQAERDRTFYSAITSQQQSFFANLMAFQSQSFQQTVTMLEQGHQRALAAANPMLLLSLFKEGMTMGRGMESEEDDNPFVRGMNVAVKGISEIKETFMLKNSMLPGSVATPAPVPGPATVKSGKKGAKPRATVPAPVPVEDQAAMTQKFMLLRQRLEEKGISLAQYMDDALTNVDEDYPDEPPEDVETDEGGTGPTGDGAGGPNVDGS